MPRCGPSQTLLPTTEKLRLSRVLPECWFLAVASATQSAFPGGGRTWTLRPPELSRGTESLGPTQLTVQLNQLFRGRANVDFCRGSESVKSLSPTALLRRLLSWKRRFLRDFGRRGRLFSLAR